MALFAQGSPLPPTGYAESLYQQYAADASGKISFQVATLASGPLSDIAGKPFESILSVPSYRIETDEDGTATRHWMLVNGARHTRVQLPEGAWVDPGASVRLEGMPVGRDLVVPDSATAIRETGPSPLMADAQAPAASPSVENTIVIPVSFTGGPTWSGSNPSQAQATSLVFDSSARGLSVLAVTCRTPSGRPIVVRARRFLLAAGCIASTQLLMQSGFWGADPFEITVGRQFSCNFGNALFGQFTQPLFGASGLQVGYADLFEPFGIDRLDPQTVAQVRFMVRFAAAEAGVAAYDGVYARVNDIEGFRTECDTHTYAPAGR